MSSSNLLRWSGLASLGIAALRVGVLPLVLGLAALLPVWVLALVHLELSVVLLGLSWMLLGYVLWSEDEPVTARRRRPAPR